MPTPDGFPSASGSCYAFGKPDDASVSDGDNNVQIARLIVALGETGEGRRGILRAVAGKQGIVDDDEIEALIDGTAKHRLRVPQGLRGAMCEIGLEDTLMPVSLITSLEKEEILMTEHEWTDMEFEVALDSGAVVHVCGPDDCPGYLMEESPGSRRKQVFLMGDGGEIPNLGQKSLNLLDTEADRDLISVFQIAAVTRPLMSVGRICDEGHNITFDSVVAVVRTKEGDELCRFHRKPGGLYVAKMKLKNPAGFGRQE